MDETSIYIDFPSNYTYEECGVKRVKAVTAGQEKQECQRLSPQQLMVKSLN